MEQTIIAGIVGIIVGVLAVVFRGRFNQRRMGGTKSDLGRAKRQAREAGDGIRVSKDTVGSLLESNRESQSLVGRARKILARARARAKRKDNTLDGG